MHQPFKKKKEDHQQHLQQIDALLIASKVQASKSQSITTLSRSLILKSAMFWDTKSRVQRVKSLMLSNMNIEEFQDSEDFSIQELSSIELLSLSKNKIIHLQPISVLDTLVTLNINHNRVYSLAPLQNLILLQELYASNNEISSISSLSTLTKLRVLNIYNNKISSFDPTMATLSALIVLEDLDLQQNPLYNEDLRGQFINLPALKRFNDKTISRNEKQGNSRDNNVSMSMTSSCLISPLNMSMIMKGTNTSFFNSSNKTHKTNRLKQLQQKFQNLEQQYSKIDDQFEEQIVKNVKLKCQFHALNQQVKKVQELKEDSTYKENEIKLMKRKAKDLKQNLFKIQSKGNLLRQLFQLETLASSSKKVEKKEIKKEIVWARRFDCDDVIEIEDYSNYMQEDRQLAELLQNNSNTLQELRRELSYFY